MTTVEGIPPIFDAKKILKVLKKKLGTLLSSHTAYPSLTGPVKPAMAPSFPAKKWVK